MASKLTNPKDVIGVRKAAMSVLPGNVLVDVALGLMEGAAKYGRHNYRGVGVRASVYYDATMRHLLAWWEGEDIDPDSALSHITKAIASLVVLRDAMMQGMCEDDRPPSSVPFMVEANLHAADVLDLHADKSPKHWTIADDTSLERDGGDYLPGDPWPIDLHKEPPGKFFDTMHTYDPDTNWR